MKGPFVGFAVAVGFAMAIVVACGGDDDTGTTAGDASSPDGTGASSEFVGQTCKTASECYPAVFDAGADGGDGGALKGTVLCLDKITNGYCTHLCTTDSDCCAVPGECKTGFKQVCSPFESTGQLMCFLSCEPEDIQKSPDGGTLDENGYCHTYASVGLGCRSTGGGKKNRKVCLAEGSVSDASTD